MKASPYPKRLIEVDLPIKRISAHARREKSIRHGHISTLHIWWARRPLAACRAVICAALWPDPVDELCPEAFRVATAEDLAAFAEKVRSDTKLAELCHSSWSRWMRTTTSSLKPSEPSCWPDMRYALLDFIAEFANWDASTVPAFLETARRLTDAAHTALGGARGTKPLVVDPFAGGGSIPLEALRVGADAFASDLNPVAVLLNKVVLEFIPKYGQRLADEVRKWGEWIKQEAEKELADFYPKDPDGATPIAYLWARTIRCEGPGCGAEVPLMRSLWLAKKGERSVALQLKAEKAEREGSEGRVEFEIIIRRDGKWGRVDNKDPEISNPSFDGTVQRGSVTCPLCGYATPVASVRKQLQAREGGAADARPIVVRYDDLSTEERAYRLPNETDLKAVCKAAQELERRKREHREALSLAPDEPLPPRGTLGFRVQLYGMEAWGDLFTPRQALALTTFAGLVRDAGDAPLAENEKGLANATKICLALALDRLADFNSSLCVLNVVGGRGVVHTFGRQALPMVWDFMETNPFNEVGANWIAAIEAFAATIRTESCVTNPGQVEVCSATSHSLPDDSAACFFTDPPYYDAVPYADLSDFFYVWLKRTLPMTAVAAFTDLLTPKTDECILDEVKDKDRAYFEQTMGKAMAEGRRVLAPDGIGVVVFAHKSTAGWEAQLQAMVDAGWTITGSWPIDTERPGRLRAQDSAALASSVHLVCRRRENADGSVRADEVGDWRDVVGELPERIRDWMPRLASEGVVGADAIFACLGPALEIFSRYARVEKASGETVSLREYLEHVWAAISKEALKTIFEGADATGFEEDARLTAMWLWTLPTGNGNSGERVSEAEIVEDPEDEASEKKLATGRYSLEFDAARKIAQGLGAHLETLGHIVEIKGERARLLSVAERTRYLFGKEDPRSTGSKRQKQPLQMNMFAELALAEEETALGVGGAPPPGSTVLDRVHQAMILFGAGRAEALKRFLVEQGIGNDRALWRLAQSLSALYPAGSDEKRWVDGVLARKKGLGF